MKNIHFIGIGGISMSGLAEIMHSQGYIVSGSDMKNSSIIQKLKTLGINIYIGQRKSNITNNIDLVVYTAAIKPNNEELLEAQKKGIKTIDRATLLGDIMKHYNYSIGVSGTHGKTTTTSMISHILLEDQKDPTISVGGFLNIINSNIKVGHSDYFVTEACEYYDSFLKFYPYIGVILNIEEDHMDYFKDLDQIENSFLNYASNIKKGGYLIINNNIKHLNQFTSKLNCNVIRVGTDNQANLYCSDITYTNNIYPKFNVHFKDKKLGSVQLSVPGFHNVINSLHAIAVGLILNIPFNKICSSLNTYNGTKKRFELKGTIKGITIIDDYAHHPTEIKATLNVAKTYPHKNLWLVFQPHTYTRTKKFLKQFSKVLSECDNIILTDIYAAREPYTKTIHSLDLLKEIKKTNKSVYYFESFDEIEKFLLQKCSPGDLLITMGAGDVSIIGEELLGL